MTHTAYVLPLRPGREEAFRRFLQEITETHWEDYVRSRRDADIHYERIWLISRGRREVVLINLGGTLPDLGLQTLARSNAPFDQWFHEQVRDLTGVDLAHLSEDAWMSPMHAWSESEVEEA